MQNDMILEIIARTTIFANSFWMQHKATEREREREMQTEEYDIQAH